MNIFQHNMTHLDSYASVTLPNTGTKFETFEQNIAVFKKGFYHAIKKKKKQKTKTVNSQ